KRTKRNAETAHKNLTKHTYPAACHPQAWSAASSVSVLSLLLGLEPCSTEPTPSESPLARGLRLNRN
ncbi:MAG: hypothetical protein ACLS6F_05675, partial [Bifidobacterium breve]